jgi:hypothetical protein
VAEARPAVLRIENARQAHRAGRVWVKLNVNGGKLKMNPADPKEPPIGRIQSEGPLTPQQGMVVYLAMLGRSPRQIHDRMVELGYVTDPVRTITVRDEEGSVVFHGRGKVDPPDELGDGE